MKRKYKSVIMIFSVIFLFTAFLLCSGQDVDKIDDRDKEEFLKISKRLKFAGLKTESILEEYNISSLVKFLPQLRSQLPMHYDWRKDYKYNVVPKAEDMSPCTIHWVFSTLYMLEVQYAIKTKGRLLSLSKQQVLDCHRPPNASGCHGNGSTLRLFRYVKNEGLTSTREYGPYLGRQVMCRHNHKKNILTVVGELQVFSGYGIVGRNLRALYELVLVTQGPFVATMMAPPKYNGGIIRIKGVQCPVNAKINHSVLIVGYDNTEDGMQYWIAKNMYGTSYGIEGGYFKIESGRNTLCIEDYGAIAKIEIKQ